MRHGQFALPITRYLRPPQVQPFFGRNMLFDILFVADWHKIGGQRQSLTDCGIQRKNAQCIDFYYKVGDKVRLINEGILRKAESAYGK
jgi:hypothetical protein